MKLRDWVKAELKALRLNYMDSAGVTSVEKFAVRAKISKEHVYKLERGDSSPTVETLNDWLIACDTSLYVFFQRLLLESEIDEAKKLSKDDVDVLRTLREGLSHTTTRRLVTDCAGHVSDFLRIGKRRVR